MKKTFSTWVLGCCLYVLLPVVGNSQNFVDGTNDASLVPIQLLSFKATLQGNSVQLDWSTATETNNSHFNIKRSLNGKDFSSIGTILGKGNTVTISSYSYLDASFPKQDLFYQLEQVDLDGKTTLSAVVLVKMSGNNQLQLSIFPNPVQGKKFSIAVNNIAEGSYHVSIINTIGTVVYSQHWKAMANAPLTIQLPPQLQAGTYVLQVQGNTTPLKLTKQLLIY